MTPVVLRFVHLVTPQTRLLISRMKRIIASFLRGFWFERWWIEKNGRSRDLCHLSFLISLNLGPRCSSLKYRPKTQYHYELNFSTALTVSTSGRCKSCRFKETPRFHQDVLWTAKNSLVMSFLKSFLVLLLTAKNMTNFGSTCYTKWKNSNKATSCKLTISNKIGHVLFTCAAALSTHPFRNNWDWSGTRRGVSTKETLAFYLGRKISRRVSFAFHCGWLTWDRTATMGGKRNYSRDFSSVERSCSRVSWTGIMLPTN